MDIVSSSLNIELGKLYAYAASTARLLAPDGTARARSESARLRAELRELRRCEGALRAKEARGDALTGAEEWMLDNAYLALREGKAAAAALRAGGTLRAAEGASLPFALSRALLRAGGGKLTEERLQCFLDGFQSVCVLRQSELEALGCAARCAVISALAEVCRAMRRSAGDAEGREGCAVILSSLFSALRTLPLMDLETLTERVNIPGLVLEQDATGEYPRMDAQTKRAYLRRLEALADARGAEAPALARELIERSRREGRHVGEFLFEETARTARAELYLAAKLALTAALALLIGYVWGLWAAALLLLPLSEAASRFSDFVLSRFVKPRRLPRMDLRRGIPPEGKSVCVLSVLLTGQESAAAAVRALEELSFACGGARTRPSLVYGLLADLPAAPTRESASDAAALGAAAEGIAALNARYGGGFCLFTRPRSFDGECWCGRERKRGALCALARQLTAGESELEVRGDAAALAGAHYILTLDGDTRVYPGSVQELIGAALHPLNRPVIDPARAVVIRGHAVIQPHVSMTLESAAATDFAILFAGGGGSDPYGALCGELRMDAFDAGGFNGKGLIEPEALLTCTAGRLEGKGVLSHDAPEGAYLRGALLGDEEFFDAFPATPAAYFRRLHRWVRGDWQNLRFLFARELPAIERARFFDKLRRSAVPPATLLALLAGFFFPARAGAAAAAAALCLLSDLILALGEALRRPRRARVRRWTRALAGFGGAIVTNFMRLWLLPWEAWVCLSAAATALWRTAVSHKKLLEWETAAQSESRRGTPGDYARLMLCVLPLGLGTLLFSAAVIGRAAGLMWLLSPLTAWALSLSAAKENTLSPADARYLRDAAADTWKYFSVFCTKEDNYLPPDNVQFRPARGAAHSVSPTNLGLAMTAAAAACDLGVIPREEALAFLSRLTDTAERLSRWRGHFYNWYDTRTLTPLEPPFISTVDSGNCCAALLTASVFAAEAGESALSARLRALAEGMDFSFLYDEKRALFTICWDVRCERAAGGWYDLMASEAVLTSYLSAARGEVPRRHWRALGRARLRQEGFGGLASWTGTMFEYLMPALFLPLVPGSLLDESARFCLWTQKRRIASGMPWGISESAFFSLDASGRWRYKAHGVEALALKRGMDAETVVSPYSSFLALALDARGAVKNLRRLERRGMRGPWGFYEAIDFTPPRCSPEGERIECVMAHHAAMSLCAAANALCGNSLVRRFFADPRVASAYPLLCERVDEGGEVLRRSRVREQERPRRLEREEKRTGGPGEKGFCLLSDGDLTLSLDEMGLKSARWGEICLLDEAFGGASLTICRGGESLRLMPSVCRRWEMSTEACRYEYETEGLRAALTVCLGAAERGVLCELELSRAGADCEAALSLTPLLVPLEDALDHPAFARLGIRAEKRRGVLLLRRITRRRDGDLFLAAACSAAAEMNAGEGGEDGTLLRPRLTLRTAVENGEGALRFALSLSRDADEAAGWARALLAGTRRARFPASAAALLGLKGGAVAKAMALAGAIRVFRPREAAPKAELWKFGISGDLPLLLCPAGAREEEELLGQFCLLRSLGVDAELAIVTDEEGEYPQRSRERVGKALARLALEPLLDVSGGVRLVPREAGKAIASRAAFVLGEERPRRESMPALETMARSGAEEIPFVFDAEGGFGFSLSGVLPQKPWQNVLTQGDFGWLVSECGSGWMWTKNAREGRIDPPPHAPESPRGSEQLWVESPHGRVSLFAAEDGLDCRVSYSTRCVRWEKTIEGRTVTLTGFLDPESGARVLRLAGAGGLTVCWRLETVVGASDGASVRCGFAEGLFRAENPESFFPGMRFLAAVSAPARCRCDWAEPGMLLSFTASEEERLVCGVCGEGPVRALCGRQEAQRALAAALALQEQDRARFSLRCSDKRLEQYMNLWCLKQTYARLKARTSLYQSGGAFGFRDQLQDAVNLLLVESESARARILEACRHQYAEGDVMHWWHEHPQGDRGVRTRCSDDLLWLCWALCGYVEATGDLGLCGERTPYLASPPLGEDESDRYETASVSDETDSVLGHALRALKCCVGRGFGSHGLPLMGAGDWNDALSDCGGESVWLAFFLCFCARSMGDLLARLGDETEARRCRALAARMLAAAEGCFNGRWYERAWPAHGDLGRSGRRIDSLVQSWAVFCGASHAAEALEYALSRLVDAKHGIVKLLDPPFSAEEERFGYIAAYGEGCRENGGQYTHAAVWLARACFVAGRADAGREILSLLLPEGRDMLRYGAEPYVLSADVCAAPGREGEAGWTWYTGSAGWYFRTVTENLLGLCKRDGKITAAPPDCALFALREVKINGEKVWEETTQAERKMI